MDTETKENEKAHPKALHCIKTKSYSLSLLLLLLLPLFASLRAHGDSRCLGSPASPRSRSCPHLMAPALRTSTMSNSFFSVPFSICLARKSAASTEPSA